MGHMNHKFIRDCVYWKIMFSALKHISKAQISCTRNTECSNTAEKVGGLALRVGVVSCVFELGGR